MKLRPLTGTITALVTPFNKDEVSYRDLEKLVEYQIKGGVDGLVPVGTTGESPTLSHEEHMDVIRSVVGKVRGRVPVIAGTGSNSTHEAVELTHRLQIAVGFLGLLGVDRADGDADVHEHIVAQFRLGRAGEADQLDDTGEADLRRAKQRVIA